MKCPYCGYQESKVVDSRHSEDWQSIRRRRECLSCHLFGKAENSVIFREVDIEDGAEVRDSIIMQGSKIGAGASIRYCILDKNVTIRPGTKLLGSIDHPLVVDKGDTV